MLALWQGAPYGYLFLNHSLVIGVVTQGAPEARAVDALTGRLVWRTVLPSSNPYVLGVLPGNDVMVIEVGHCNPANDTTFQAINASAAEILDLGTGRLLWTTSIQTSSNIPPIALAADLVVTGEPSESLTARKARTGVVAWRKSPPEGCSPPPHPPFPYLGVSVAGDGQLLVASYQCEDSHALVQRLNASTGQVLWRWRSPGAYRSQNASFNAGWLPVVGVAEQGSVVLLSGSYNPSQSPADLVGTVSSYTWPKGLGLARGWGYLLALDGTTGTPRWLEDGAAGLDYPFETSFSLTSGVVCQAVAGGVECRDDVTGTLTQPTIVTGRWTSSGDAQDGDRWAGIAGGMIAVTAAPPNASRVSLEVLPVRAGSAIAQATLSVGAALPPPPPQECAPRPCNDTYVVGAGVMPDGAILIFLRRVDLANYPVEAIRVARPSS